MVSTKFRKSILISATFTIGMMGNETGHLLKCVELYEKAINISETSHMLRGNIAVTLLKILCNNLFSVKCYDKTNMNVFALSL